MDTVLPVSTYFAISSAKTFNISRVSSSETRWRLLPVLMRDVVVVVYGSSSSLEDTCRSLFLDTTRIGTDEDDDDLHSLSCLWKYWASSSAPWASLISPYRK
ncbi:hypothetical protein DPMN_141138 [Dreissena polymorpha]|uniref:Uncharacterized protein n=1 Tax=Dreissena polymorpha TaxID=45954 RepID=A0A9D4GCU0_DREPO|nr:hypothetical protein DPMN_141138 [Dreissena polymorpha]